MPGPAPQTQAGGASPKPGAGSRAGPNVRNRKPGGSQQKKSSGSVAPGGQMGAGNMWKFYTEDSPGIKVGPVPVLVMSLMFIASVFILHIWGKYTRS